MYAGITSSGKVVLTLKVTIRKRDNKENIVGKKEGRYR
jgi:hypothetical protein